MYTACFKEPFKGPTSQRGASQPKSRLKCHYNSLFKLHSCKRWMLAAIQTKENEPISVFRGRERCKAGRRISSTRSTILVISDKSLCFCIVSRLLPQTVNVTGQRRSRAEFCIFEFLRRSRLPMRLSTCLFTTMEFCEPSSLFSRHLTLLPH